MKKIKFAVIGLGARGSQLMNDIFTKNKRADVVALCDKYEDRVDKANKLVEEELGHSAFCTQNYKDIFERDDIDAVVISCDWELHIPIAIDVMEHNIPAIMEVSGAYSIEQCWDLVRCWEKTKTPFWFTENCCYGRRELMALNMVEKGLFGEIIHCSGGYHHDLRKEVAFGKENRHYRLKNYINRNCENYPTHEIGPIAKILNINYGNRMVSLTSTASKAAGMHEYILEKKPEDTELVNTKFAQGDIITTVIKCAHGQTITLTLDTTLPHYYSRGFTVRGTKGLYEEFTDSVFIDGKDDKFESEWNQKWGNAKEYEEEYDHPIWKKFVEEGVQGGHGGMDWLQYEAIIDFLIEGTDAWIDVYDAATWMCISVLSEKSISMGSMPVEIPDFTNGMWQHR